MSSYDPHHLKCFFKYMKKLIKAGKAKNCKIKQSKGNQPIVFIDKKRVGNLKRCLPKLDNLLKDKK